MSIRTCTWFVLLFCIALVYTVCLLIQRGVTVAYGLGDRSGESYLNGCGFEFHRRHKDAMVSRMCWGVPHRLNAMPQSMAQRHDWVVDALDSLASGRKASNTWNHHFRLSIVCTSKMLTCSVYAIRNDIDNFLMQCFSFWYLRHEHEQPGHVSYHCHVYSCAFWLSDVIHVPTIITMNYEYLLGQQSWMPLVTCTLGMRWQACITAVVSQYALVHVSLCVSVCMCIMLINIQVLGFRKNLRWLAMYGTFFISAVFHEYIIVATFRFFYPVLFIMFGIVGGEWWRVSSTGIV